MTLLSLLFTGDFAPCRKYEKIVLDKGKEVFGNLQPYISGADLSFLNLETPLCLGAKEIKKTGPNFSAHPDCIKSVSDACYDIIGLANNHIMDFGAAGLQQTLEVCTNEGLLTCGAGINLEKAQQPLFIDKFDLKLAFIAVAENEFSIASSTSPGAAPLDPVNTIYQIDIARKQAEMVFISIHGGNEYFPFPRPGLRKLCRFYIDYGADGVICHHTHVPGAYELYNNKIIVYSLGNLIFDRNKQPSGWNEGYAVRLEYDTKTHLLYSHEFIPYTQAVAQGGIIIMSEKEKIDFMKRLNAYSDTLHNADAYTEAWKNFCFRQKKQLLFNMFFPLNFRGLGRLNKYLSLYKLMLKKSTLPHKKNILSCDSHLEILKFILNKKCQL